MRAIFVTSNENKRREAEGVLGVKLDAASPELPEIQSLDFAEVVRHKALAAYDALALDLPPTPILVEDSGIVFGAWNGMPGALTKWFLESSGNEGLLKMLASFEDRSARAVCCVAVVDGAGEVEVFTGEVGGTISEEPRGEGGFGWDSIFVPEGSSRTYAEMGEEKNSDSHRARAFRSAGKWLAKQ
ncbi:MAG: RdgB/HAM1 family non-canonical purine NTP pyrophosphatase [Rubrobacter sp.]|nr:RdgB/HAM1 family non-canonical purine NTP pyrophosphatase [Rubrobacter sp.]